jgi:DNA invertase Pin-like site-specific DNA recombinase
MFLDPPLVPRNGRTLEVLVPVRVSDPRPGKQDERSLDEQRVLLETWLKAHTKLPVKVHVLAWKGSGEGLENEEYLRLLRMIGSRKFDLVLCEDLGRIVRRIHAHLVCELCEDTGTRLIALNDHVDTAQSNWRDASIFAAWHHERANRDTSERIKRTHRGRFAAGGCLPQPIFGIIKPAGAKTDADLRKDPPAEVIYKDWFAKLDDGGTYADVSDWLNGNKTPLPPHARGKSGRREWLRVTPTILCSRACGSATAARPSGSTPRASTVRARRTPRTCWSARFRT